MLATMKLICLRLSPDDVQQIDNLRFNVILRMLKSEHFNARMNALKEVGIFNACLNVFRVNHSKETAALQVNVSDKFRGVFVDIWRI